MTAFLTHRCAETVLVNMQDLPSILQIQTLISLQLPASSSLIILSLLWTSLLPWLLFWKRFRVSCFCFFCLFKDHVPSQWEMKQNHQREPDASTRGQPQRGMGMGYRLWELWFPLSFQKINVGKSITLLNRQPKQPSLDIHTSAQLLRAVPPLTFWTALNMSSCTCSICVLCISL